MNAYVEKDGGKFVVVWKCGDNTYRIPWTIESQAEELARDLSSVSEQKRENPIGV